MKETGVAETKPKMKRKQYEKELRQLQTELCRLQEWVKLKGLRVIVVFEGATRPARAAPSRRSRSA